MKNKLIVWTLCYMALGQSCKQSKYFLPVYPIGENPRIGYISSAVPEKEKIYFESQPILRMSLFNNIQRQYMNSDKDFASAWYLSFRPHLRMYNQNSKPVKTPSYKISIIGHQGVYRFKNKEKEPKHFFTYSFESGHYSNGQSRCAFNKELEDESLGCMTLYEQIDANTNLSNLLNRESGNFSTNYTELIIKHFYITKYNDYNTPLSKISFQAGYNRYHDNLLWVADIGGYTNEDIKIYGKNRFLFKVDAFYTLNTSRFPNWLKHMDRIEHAIDYEFISKPHESVNPHRIVFTNTLYFKNNMGVYISGIYGHDSYNYRFVDSGFQFSAGIMFDIFPPIQLMN